MARSGFSHYQSYTTQKNNRKKLFRFIRWFLLIYAFFLVFQAIFIRTIRIDNQTMVPSLAEGTTLIASPLPYGAQLPLLPVTLPGWKQPDRGDLVELVPPYHQELTGPLGFFNDLIKFLSLNLVSLDQFLKKDWDNALSIRRIIGIPGDRVKIDDFTASVRPKDQDFALSEFELTKSVYHIEKGTLPEGWLKDYPLSGSQEELTLGDDEFFVLADNRGGANDSRTYGVVKKTAIKAQLLFRYWPLSSFGGF